MMKIKNKLPRIPAVLANEIFDALAHADSLGQGRRRDLLARYRRNLAKQIAVWGVSNFGVRVNGLEAMPWHHLTRIARLNTAYEKLYDFRHGGAGDYAAVDVERAINSLRASAGRVRDNHDDEICEYLMTLDYTNSNNKKALVMSAVEYFNGAPGFGSCSESMVRRAIRRAGLTRRKQSAVT